MKTHYRGFDITLTQAGAWSARITNARTGRSFSRQPSTALEDGSTACIQRAKNLVDTFIALRGDV